MKSGIEVEGRLKGVKTAFIHHTEVNKLHRHIDPEMLHIVNKNRHPALQNIGHVYVSCLEGCSITDAFIREICRTFKEYLVTMEVCDLSKANLQERPRNLTIMLNMDAHAELYRAAQVTFETTKVDQRHMPPCATPFGNVSQLDADDMIKFGSGQNVLVTTKRNFVRTEPADFAGDVEVGP